MAAVPGPLSGRPGRTQSTPGPIPWSSAATSATRQPPPPQGQRPGPSADPASARTHAPGGHSENHHRRGRLRCPRNDANPPNGAARSNARFQQRLSGPRWITPCVPTNSTSTPATGPGRQQPPGRDRICHQAPHDPQTITRCLNLLAELRLLRPRARWQCLNFYGAGHFDLGPVSRPSPAWAGSPGGGAPSPRGVILAGEDPRTIER